MISAPVKTRCEIATFFKFKQQKKLFLQWYTCIKVFINRLHPIVCVEDDLCGEGWPLENVLSMSQDATNRIGDIRPKLGSKVVVIKDLDVGTKYK